MLERLAPTTSAHGESQALLRDGPGGGDPGLRRSAAKRLWPGALCCALYLTLAMVVYGFGSVGAGHMAGVGTLDNIAQIWWLAWAAHALPQVHDLFLAQGQNYPYGQNFAVNGSMLALGVLFAPVTKIFGPVVTYNVLLRLALVASATSMCFVLRRWTTWWPAAFVGGLIYGFSAYTSIYGPYLFLIFVPLPPLILLLLHEICVRQRWRAGRTGVALGLLCAVQFFIWVEVLAGTVVIGLCAVALIAIVTRRHFAERWRYAATAFAYAFGVAGVLLAYPLVFAFTGPQHINGPPNSSSYLASLNGDLVSPLIPTSREWLDPSVIWRLGPADFNSVTNLLYLGLPLVIVLICFAVFLRGRKEILFAGAMALIAFVLSLGSRLEIDGHTTPIPLPFAVFADLPALSGFEARRFALFTDLFAAAMFAIGIDEMWKRLAVRAQASHISHGWSKALGATATGALIVAVALALVPSDQQPSVPTNVPAFFTSAAEDSIPPGGVVLAYPYPDNISNNWWSVNLPVRSPLLDQAAAGMRFDLIGGYGWFPSPAGHGGVVSPALLEPQSVQALFDSGYLAATTAEREVLRKSDVTADLRTFLRRYDVQTVLVVNLPRTAVHFDTATVVTHVTAAIGPPVETGGVTVWFHVPQRLDAVTPGRRAVSSVRRAVSGARGADRGGGHRPRA